MQATAEPKDTSAAAAAPTTTLRTLQLPAIGTHWPKQGGVFAGILRGAPGQPDAALIIPTGAQFELQGQWGEYGKDVPGATSRTDSAANTSAMAAAGSTIAQQVLALRDDAGRADYAIPSQAALQLAAANVPELFAQEWYWSSTQDSRDDAFVQDFEHGLSNWVSKGISYRVRAVRTIHLTA